MKNNTYKMDTHCIKLEIFIGEKEIIKKHLNIIREV